MSYKNTIDALEEVMDRNEAGIQSPARLRRALTVEETDDIKRLVKHLRYQEGHDDSYFFTLAQAAQVEAKKIVKMGALKNKK